MSNVIAFLGRLTKDPELKDVGGTQLLSFSVANDVGFGQKKTVNFYNCSIWGKRAESMQAHLSKGSQLFITGELALRKFTAKDGSEKISPDVRVDALDFASAPKEVGSPQAQASQSSEDETSLPF